MKLKFISIIFTLSLTSGCVLIRNECGVRNPKTYRFKILNKKEVYSDITKIRVNGVYINYFPDKNNIEHYSFVRFFENGRYFLSKNFQDFPNEQEINDLNCGGYGHFKIQGDKIIVETYVNSAGYVYHYFDLGINRIISAGAKKRLRTSNDKYNMIPVRLEYIFFETNLYSEPYW